MASTEYRLYLDDEPVTRDQLNLVDEITVEQQIDMAWEARLRIPLCTDEKGTWGGSDAAIASSFARIRVEIRVAGESFIPIMDGPVVGKDTQMSTEPGQSWITVIVQDDSVHLNRDEEVITFDGRRDDEVAADLFGRFSQIASTDIEVTPAPTTDLPPIVVQRGTAIEILRQLARRQGMHAFVLPGANARESVGVFKHLPAEPGGLPPLVLLGAERNVFSFNVTNNAQRPARVQGWALNITDKAVASATSQFRNLELLGDEAAFSDEAQTGTQFLPPGADDAVNLDERVQRESDRSSFAFSASGTLLADCYPGVLLPYQVVTARGVDARLAGDYIIKRVSHRLTRSTYSQTFDLLRNAQSRKESGGVGDLAGAIF
jgi:hypothetical protein